MAQRYKVQYEAESKRFSVLDTLIGTATVASFATAVAAEREATDKENSWQYAQQHLGPSELFDWMVAP